MKIIDSESVIFIYHFLDKVMLLCVVFLDVIVIFNGSVLRAWMYLFSSSRAQKNVTLC